MYIFLFLLLAITLYITILIIKGERFSLVNWKKTKLLDSVSNYLNELNKRKILLKEIKLLTPENIIISSIMLFFLSIILFHFVIGVISTAIIVSLPILILPAIVSKILIKKNKEKILDILPMYVVNIKNFIDEDNNIILAIINTKVEAPLNVFTEKFKSNVTRGMNVIESLDILKDDVGIKEFSNLITGIKLCYINGGDFKTVLDKYILIMTKEAEYKEEAKEKSFSSILTLIIMIVLNIAVVWFMLNNNEYASIIRTNFLGKLILNFNAISYMVIAFFMWKIYKEE